MAVQTTKTLLDTINEAMKGKIVYWTELEKMHFGKIVYIDKRGIVIVDQSDLPKALSAYNNTQNPIKTLQLDEATIGVYEVSSLN